MTDRTGPARRPGPGVARVRGALLIGVRAEIIEVQATVSGGAPGFAITGVRDDDTHEIGDQVRAAVLNSGLAWPSGVVTVDLGAASLFRRGCGLDLPIAVAVLAAAGTVPLDAAPGCVFAAGLGMDGRLRPVAGIVPVLAAATAHGVGTDDFPRCRHGRWRQGRHAARE